MYEWVHRHAPENPTYRAALAALFGVIGVLPTLVGLNQLTFRPAAGGFYLLLAAGLFAVSTQLLRGLTRQADAADTVPVADESTAESAVDRLRRRYADGEVSDEAFDRRLDRLLETENAGRGSRDGRRATDRTNERTASTNGRTATDRRKTTSGRRPNERGSDGRQVDEEKD